ncbi:MAG TPA: serine/threonine-protein kinase [Candidatus Polarisedimenticolia bacterium]|jgi:serine/threonine-protein kinase|nr:serine/threonine-protein kinase [Candidatus Polarisedimenticolia bacterium]
MIRCPSCAGEVPAGHRFCGTCGSSLPSDVQDETRTVVRRAESGAGSPAKSSPGEPLEARFPPGTILASRYRVVGLLGRGGMGEVYRADDLKLGQRVALKFLPQAVEGDPRRLGRFLNEVRMALRVSHPHVCRVHDVGEAEGHHFISMEYVDGEDLASLLRRIGRLPQDKAIQAARQICAGLAAAHDRGILHRDLKPANVMLDGRGQVKITDFGLASAADAPGTELGAGTPAYMAPEQLDGKAATLRSDLYALGLVLYEMFTGKPAFAGKSRAEIGHRRATPPSSPSSHLHDIDPAVERVILRCLEVDPKNRPGSALSVAAALPGGDPLAAAIAAGETPSPLLVAEAGPSEGLEPGAAVACLAVVLIALALAVALSGRLVLVRRSILSKPPEALTDKAREAIQLAGWKEVPADSLFEFHADDDYLAYLRRHPALPDPWEILKSDRPPGLLFCYRQSPRPLLRLGAGIIGNWNVDPPSTLPGMVQVELTPAGKLMSFAAVPPERSDSTEPPGDANWTPLFAAASLDPRAFTEVQPIWTPRSFADRRIAWKGVYPEAPETKIRIEAASYRGRPIAFRIISPWSAPEESRSPELSFWARARGLVSSVWFAVTLMGAALVASRNVRLGRGDHRTALRLASCMGGARLLWLAGAQHVPGNAEVFVFMSHLAWALYYAGLTYLFYLALEPYARKLWPRMLVSWIRLLGGAFRDPLVGRDLLIAAVFGTVSSLIRRGSEWSHLAFGIPGAPLETGFFSLESLRGLRQAFTAVVAVPTRTVQVTFFGITMFLVLRLLLRKTPLAIIAMSALALVLFNPGADNPWPFLIGFTTGIALFWIVFFRWGLLAVVLGGCVEDLLTQLPLTVDPTAWYSEVTLLVLLIVLGIAVWGFRVAVGRRTLFSDEIAEPGAALG